MDNLLLNLVELQLASGSLVLLLLKSSFSLVKSSLKLYLLNLQSLANLVDLMYGHDLLSTSPMRCGRMLL